MRVDAASGAVLETIDVDASGIDLVAAGDSVWVATGNAAVEGLPTTARLLRVGAGAACAVWLADNTNGVLYRVPVG